MVTSLKFHNEAGLRYWVARLYKFCNCLFFNNLKILINFDSFAVWHTLILWKCKSLWNLVSCVSKQYINIKTINLSLGTTWYSDFTTVPASLQLLIHTLLICKKYIKWISVLNMFFYTVHPISSTDSNRLIIESSVLFTYVTRRQEIEGVVLYN